MRMKLKYELLGRKAIKESAKHFGLSPGEYRKQIAETIDAAWTNPTTEQMLIQKKLFPYGKPSPEEFIIVMAIETSKTQPDSELEHYEKAT